MKSSPEIFIALGANLPGRSGAGPLETCQRALKLLSKKGIEVTAVSRAYESAPWPPSDQPWYTNAVAGVETPLDPRSLVQALLEVEENLGRIRTRKNAPRIVDLDLIDYAGRILPSKEGWLAAQMRKGEKGIFVPHLRAHERVFVLKPLLDIAPSWVHPVLLKTGKELFGRLNEGGQIRPARGSLRVP